MYDVVSVDFHRVKNLFHMDLHRMVHGKVFYVMVCIAIFIPVMMLTQMSDVTNIMTFIGGSAGSDAGALGAGMNLSIMTVLTGMLLSIYIGKEYASGHIKNIITSHANKCDYIISKAMIGFICNAVFITVYLITLFALGTVMGLPIEISSMIGFVLYVLEKLLLAIPMIILMIMINLVFRRSYGWSIVFVCVAGTGILVVSAQTALQMLGFDAAASILNYTITGASTVATLTPSFYALIVIVLVAIVWTLLFTIAADYLMNKRDVL